MPTSQASLVLVSHITATHGTPAKTTQFGSTLLELASDNGGIHTLDDAAAHLFGEFLGVVSSGIGQFPSHGT